MGTEQQQEFKSVKPCTKPKRKVIPFNDPWTISFYHDCLLSPLCLPISPRRHFHKPNLL